ncbi:MAG: RNA polymerase sigma factor [Candidatus Dojkabacteria bacterium]
MKIDLKKEKELFIQSQENLARFSALYEFHAPHVYRYAYSLLGKKEDAEDVTADSFLQVVKQIRQMHWKGKSIRPYLFTVCRNKCMDTFRKTSEETFDEELVESHEVPIIEKVADKQLVSQIKSKINTLIPEYREILYLKLVEDFSFKEIAAQLNMSENTCKTRYYRAIGRVKGEMKQNKMHSFTTPVLLGSLTQAMAIPKSQLPPSVQQFQANKLLVNELTKIMNNGSLFTQFISNKVAVGITAVTAGTTAIGLSGAGMYQKYDTVNPITAGQKLVEEVSKKNDNNTSENTITVKDQEEETSPIITHTDEKLGIKLTYDSSLYKINSGVNTQGSPHNYITITDKNNSYPTISISNALKPINGFPIPIGGKIEKTIQLNNGLKAQEIMYKYKNNTEEKKTVVDEKEIAKKRISGELTPTPVAPITDPDGYNITYSAIYPQQGDCYMNIEFSQIFRTCGGHFPETQVSVKIISTAEKYSPEKVNHLVEIIKTIEAI